MAKKSIDYLCYLLRLWRDGEASPWRASLEPPGGAEIKTFPSLAALVEFLETQTGERLGQPPPEEKGGDKDREG
jgi:hypothetical protein